MMAPQEEPVPSQPVEKEKDFGLLWVIIVIISLLAVGGILFTVIWTVKNRKKPEGDGDGEDVKVWPEKKKDPTRLWEEKEKARRRRIADEISAMPPVIPKKAEKKEEAPDLGGDSDKTPDETSPSSPSEKPQEEAPLPKKKAKKVISFEDLEG
jgi:FtsZ-interacting cell division protein ZipA